MPHYYAFYDENGKGINLQDVDDIVREICGLTPDTVKNCDEYECLTWMVIGKHSTFQSILDDPGTEESLKKMLRGLIARKITFKAWYSR